VRAVFAPAAGGGGGVGVDDVDDGTVLDHDDCRVSYPSFSSIEHTSGALRRAMFLHALESRSPRNPHVAQSNTLELSSVEWCAPQLLHVQLLNL
jgi:hypothetical protein